MRLPEVDSTVVFMGVFEEDKFTFEEDKADKSFTCRLQQFTANPQKSRNPLKSAKIQKFSALELELKCFFFCLTQLVGMRRPRSKEMW